MIAASGSKSSIADRARPLSVAAQCRYWATQSWASTGAESGKPGSLDAPAAWLGEANLTGLRVQLKRLPDVIRNGRFAAGDKDLRCAGSKADTTSVGSRPLGKTDRARWSHPWADRTTLRAALHGTSLITCVPDGRRSRETGYVLHRLIVCIANPDANSEVEA
jgi:hypothetical protein